MIIGEHKAGALTVAPGGADCLCGRGEAIGTLTWTSGRMSFRAFHDGPACFHHENSTDWACLDCVADTALAVAAGKVREDMRRIARERIPALVRPAGTIRAGTAIMPTHFFRADPRVPHCRLPPGITLYRHDPDHGQGGPLPNREQVAAYGNAGQKTAELGVDP